jgi:hypothetical protein
MDPVYNYRLPLIRFGLYITAKNYYKKLFYKQKFSFVFS